MDFASARERLLARRRGDAVPGPAESPSTAPPARRRPLIPSRLAELVAAAPADAPWRTRVEVRPALGGWLRVMDPSTSEVHEIRVEDAPPCWAAQGRG